MSINVPKFGTGKERVMGKFAAKIERVITMVVISVYRYWYLCQKPVYRRKQRNVIIRV